MATRLKREPQRFYRQEKEAALSAANTFSDPIDITGAFNFSLSGTFSGTVTLQRSFDLSTWRDVQTYTAPVEDVGDEPEFGAFYRFGFKTGEYTSGTANGRLGQ